MKQLSKADRDLAQSIADYLEEQHKHHASQAKLCDDFVYKGYCGEIFFAREYELPFIFVDRPGGDSGIDYTTETGISIDVKTVDILGLDTIGEARDKRHLLVEKDHIKAEIYVMCGYIPDGQCHLMGWEYGEKLKKITPKRFPAVGKKINHAIKGREIHPIEELETLLYISAAAKEQENIKNQSIEEWLLAFDGASQ